MSNNKIKPFCVELKDISYEQLWEIHQMCLDAGAGECESPSEWYFENYDYFGVNDENFTVFYDSPTSYSDNYEEFIQTYDQVANHLGLVDDSQEDNFLEKQTFVEGIINGFPFKVPESKWDEFSKTVVFTTKYLLKDVPVHVNVQE